MKRNESMVAKSYHKEYTVYVFGNIVAFPDRNKIITRLNEGIFRRQ